MMARKTPFGLCSECRHGRKVGNRQGSTFLLCRRSAADPNYPKYPHVPVTRCPGYEAGPESPDPRQDPRVSLGEDERMAMTEMCEWYVRTDHDTGELTDQGRLFESIIQAIIDADLAQ